MNIWLRISRFDEVFLCRPVEVALTRVYQWVGVRLFTVARAVGAWHVFISLKAAIDATVPGSPQRWLLFTMTGLVAVTLFLLLARWDREEGETRDVLPQRVRVVRYGQSFTVLRLLLALLLNINGLLLWTVLAARTPPPGQSVLGRAWDRAKQALSPTPAPQGHENARDPPTTRNPAGEVRRPREVRPGPRVQGRVGVRARPAN